MGTIDLPKSLRTPNQQKPVGDARTKPVFEDLHQAVQHILDEETGNILTYLAGKLPPDGLKRLDSRENLKERLYDAIDRHYQGMVNRSAGEQDDAAFARLAPGEVAELLKSMGGAKFNSGEIEKSAGNRRNNDLEYHTNSVLRQKTDAGAFLGNDTAGSVVKCVFRDNELKPKTVTDVKLSINIPDADLVSPVFHCYAAAKYLIKDLISRHIIECIDKAFDGAGDKDIEEKIEGLFAEIASAGFSVSISGRGNRKHADVEQIRTCGFNAAVNSLVSILDSSKMGYQVIENVRGRECTIQEYDDSETANLPDERYVIRLRYGDREQLVEDRAAYDGQVTGFEREVQHLWNLIEVIYQDSKSVFRVNDFEDLSKKNKGRIRDLIKNKNGEGPYKFTGEISGQGSIRIRLARMQERIKNMYEFLYPIERRVMEERLDGLEKEYSRLDFIINPHLLQPGLLVDVEVTSIKRKKTTLDSMADALNEFLHSVYGCFQDAGVGYIAGNK